MWPFKPPPFRAVERPGRPFRVLSFGAGVQSTTLAFLPSAGLIPQWDFAVFADTGLESRAVYEHLDWVAARVPYPVYRVRARGGDLGDKLRLGEHPLPLFVGDPGQRRPHGMLRRQCTKTFKVEPVLREVRERIAPGRSQLHVRDGEPWVHQGLGISTDEASRMKPSRVKWARTIYPLIDLDWSRGKCLEWLSDQGISAPRSACVICPYRSDAEWRAVQSEPDDWRLALELDAAIAATEKGDRRWLHRGMTRLADADFSDNQLGLWGNDCEGGCGL